MAAMAATATVTAHGKPLSPVIPSEGTTLASPRFRWHLGVLMCHALRADLLAIWVVSRSSRHRRVARHFMKSDGQDTKDTKEGEPYFAPNGGFGLLLAAMVVGVVSASFLLFLGLLGVVSNIPFLAALAPAPGVAAKLAELAIPPYMGVATAGIAASGALFLSRREELADRWKQWGLLALLIFLLLCVTGINVVVSFVFRSLDNVLVAKNESAFYTQLQLFIVVLVVAVPTIAFYRFVRMSLANAWRQNLSVMILDEYFAHRAYYLLDSNSTSTKIDNPDQRISEDIDAFTSETLGFLLDILGSFSNLLSFAAILWTTSEQLTYALVVYAALGTVIALSVGSTLIGINYKQLQLQADFRYSLVHVRDNAEAIAFYQGEQKESDVVKDKLRAAVQNYDKVIQWTTGLTFYQKVFFYVARLVPYFVVGGLYFAGKVDFGTFGQVSFAFSMVLSSVTIIVNRIQDISRFSAGVNRLGMFYEAIALSRKEFFEESSGDARIATHTHDSDSEQIALEKVTIWTPTGTLVKDVSINLSVPTGGSMELPSRLLVVGSSGVGKSSILRAIAGLWTQGRGSIRRPQMSEMFFLPQKPYMPLGDLRSQLLYPSEPGATAVDDDVLRQVLGRFGLGDLPSRFEQGFETVVDWTRVLSLGEQQRLAAARCLIAKPRMVVLDEATSALPVPDERNLYKSLEDRGIGYVSVGHRPSLVEYHDLILEYEDRLMSVEISPCRSHVEQRRLARFCNLVADCRVVDVFSQWAKNKLSGVGGEHVPTSQHIAEYKFVIYDPKDNSATWEGGGNRFYGFDASGEIITKSGPAEGHTPLFGVIDGYGPRYASGRSRKTSFSADDADAYAVPIPITPKAKTSNASGSFLDELHFDAVCGITGVGDIVVAVGSCIELGNWEVDRGLKLCTSGEVFPRWMGMVHVKSCDVGTIEFKLAIHRAGGAKDWETSGNRQVRLPQGADVGPWQALCEWGNSHCQTQPLRTSDREALAAAAAAAAAAEGQAGSTTKRLPEGKYGKEDADIIKAAMMPPKASTSGAETSATSASSATSANSANSATTATEAPVAAAPILGQATEHLLKKQPHTTTAAFGDAPRRSTSLSLLMDQPLLAEQWARRKDSGPPPKEQRLNFKMKGLSESDAKKLVVEVVFQEKSNRPPATLELANFDAEEQQAAWSIAVRTADLTPGIHFFHFRVNQVYVVSTEHMRLGRWNAMHVSDPVRRYLLARDSKGQLSEDAPIVEKTRSKKIGDMAMDSCVVSGSTADVVGLQELGGQNNIARPYSVCGNLVGNADSDDEAAGQDSGNSFNPFAKEVYEGLFDRELMLRLDGVVLPEVPPPPEGKDQLDEGAALRLWAGAHLIKKAHGACEDAYFVDPHGMGVADGVGCMVQFASYGINAAQYAAELMEFSSAALKPEGTASELKIRDDVAERAAVALAHGESHAAAYGASTVSVLCQQGNQIGVANLGDSGFMLLRKGPHGMNVVMKSEEQQHSWNCPYQLTRLPKALLNRFPKLQLDKASDCERYTVEVKEGDLVLMFSDGLRDNLHDREVVSIVDRALPPAQADMLGLLDRCTPPETIAKALALAAQERSMDPTAKVPFVEYSKRHGFECLGGKQDDITVVAAWVWHSSSQELVYSACLFAFVCGQLGGLQRKFGVVFPACAGRC
ncbi:unnamed protein product [Symbiodinium natans]|uniref:Uncharacterized protein n=1 Tax=Symbiodinium natans TaxID=878477 RepID=A0A812SJA4_9DINO|nr:unnamed protein product [Symbiodinium natans]